MKKMIAVLAAVMLLAGVMTACGDKDDKATPDSAAKDSAATETVTEKIAETTRVLETTAEGGTLEADAEGNVIETDKNGDIVSVKDKNGTVISVTEYITTHQIILSDGGEGKKASSASSSAAESSSKSSSRSEETSSKPESKPESVSSVEDEPVVSDPVEEETEFPGMEVIIPDGSDEYELPII